MSTDETQGQEAPERFPNETEEEDTEGHVHPNATSDPDFANRGLGVHPNATADEDDTEGHIKTGGH